MWWADDGEELRFQQMIALDPAATTPAPAPQALWQRVHDQVAGIQKIDPQFSPEGVVSRAASLLRREFDAENAMDSSGMPGVSTPDFMQFLDAKIAQWRAEGMRRVVTKASLDPGVLFKVAIDGDAQRVVVRVTGSAVRYTEDVALGGLSDGSRDSASFTEFVTLRRPAGAVTAATSAPAKTPSVCPSCGAPIAQGESSCKYCGAALLGAVAADWLLDRLSESAYT